MSEASYTAVSVDEESRPWMKIQSQLESLEERVSRLEKTQTPSEEEEEQEQSVASFTGSRRRTKGGKTAPPSSAESESSAEYSSSDEEGSDQSESEAEEQEKEEDQPTAQTEAPTAENMQRIVMAERPKLRFDPRDAKTVMSAATAKESVISAAVANSTASSDASFYDGSDLAPDV